MHAPMLVLRILYLVLLFGICVPTLRRTVCISECSRLAMAMVFLLIYCMGDVLETLCRSQDAAVVAMKFTHIALLQAVGMMALFVQRYTKVRLPSPIFALISVFNLIIVCVLATCDYHSYYAKAFRLIEAGTYSRLAIIPGPFYYAYHGLLAAYAISIPAMVAYFQYQERTVYPAHQKRNLIFLAAMLLPGIAYGIDAAGVLQPFEVSPIALLATLGMLFLLISKYQLFDVLESGKNISLDSIGQAIFITDERYHILYSNETASRLLGHFGGNPASVLGKTAENGEFTGDGRRYERRVTPVLNNEVLKGYSVWIIDITENYEMMQKLISMKNAADHASETKSTILASTSHEIRTPMNVIIGMSEIALRKSMSEDLRSNLEAILHAGKLMLNMVNHVLDISKIESGNVSLQEQEYYLDSMLMDVSMLACSDLYGRPIHFALDMRKGIPNGLVGDVVRIKEILVNLLGNATKYTEKGEIKLTVNYKPGEDGVLVLFTVSDTGIGIRPEDREYIFKPYQQANTGLPAQSGGVGLGLTIVKHLVEMMGGRIYVESTYGEGSAFHVELPQRVFDTRPAESGDAVQHGPSQEQQSVQGVLAEAAQEAEIDILVVDDVALNLMVAEGLLNAYGVHIHFAQSGAQAMEAVLHHRFDMIFMDYVMQDMDGAETMWKIREMQDGAFRNVPIVALTASAKRYKPEFFTDKGFDAVLEKPIQIPQMEQLLRQLLSDKKLLRHTDPEPPASPGFTICGVDTEKGLRQCGGRLQDYCRILGVYLAEAERLAEELPVDAQQDPADFARKVHGLKGTSRVIGAMELGDAAEQLEQCAKNGEMDQARALLPRFLQQTQVLLQHLRQVLPAETAGPTPCIGEDSLGPDWWKAMLDAVKQYDLEAANVLLRSAMLRPCRPDTVQQLRQLRELLDTIEYEAAEELILRQIEHQTKE